MRISLRFDNLFIFSIHRGKHTRNIYINLPFICIIIYGKHGRDI